MAELVRCLHVLPVCLACVPRLRCPARTSYGMALTRCLLALYMPVCLLVYLACAARLTTLRYPVCTSYNVALMRRLHCLYTLPALPGALSSGIPARTSYGMALMRPACISCLRCPTHYPQISRACILWPDSSALSALPVHCLFCV